LVDLQLLFDFISITHVINYIIATNCHIATVVSRLSTDKVLLLMQLFVYQFRYTTYLLVLYLIDLLKNSHKIHAP